jgi:hypothetical protein
MEAELSLFHRNKANGSNNVCQELTSIISELAHGSSEVKRSEARWSQMDRLETATSLQRKWLRVKLCAFFLQMPWPPSIASTAILILILQ